MPDDDSDDTAIPDSGNDGAAEDTTDDGSAPTEPTGPAHKAFGFRVWIENNLSAEARLGKRPSAARQAQDDAKTPQEKSDAARQAVNGLEPLERRVGIFAVIAEAAIIVLVAVSYLAHHNKGAHSQQVAPSAFYLFLVEAAVLGAFLLIGILVKRRALLGFASLLTGMWILQEIKPLALMGFAYLAFGIWLVARALKFTPNAKDRAAKNEAARETRAARRSKSAASSEGSRNAPPPNKRYTPPKPPSRAELARKQAAAAATKGGKR
jgi:hypothetical protein